MDNTVLHETVYCRYLDVYVKVEYVKVKYMSKVYGALVLLPHVGTLLDAANAFLQLDHAFLPYHSLIHEYV